MAIKIARKYYENLRGKFPKLASRFNGILSVKNLLGKSPNWGGNTVPGVDGNKIQMNDKIPEENKAVLNKGYTGEVYDDGSYEINPEILEESSLIHTLGNENYIRNKVGELNDMSHNFVGKDFNLVKQTLKEKGSPTNESMSGVKKYSDLSPNVNDTVRKEDKQFNETLLEGFQLLDNPSSTSNVTESNVLTYNVDKPYKLDRPNIDYSNNEETVKVDGVVKYTDYEEILNVLDKIDQCLSKRNIWFDANGRCQLSCQVMCQNQCQLSCQACNRKQCHLQKCGVH